MSVIFSKRSAPSDLLKNDMENLSYETLIATLGSVVIHPTGISMRPFLKEGRDSVVVCAPSEPLKKYDIVLYRAPDGGYVMHRIIKIDGEKLVICGDNCRGWEHGHTTGDIIGVVTAVCRGEKQEQVHSVKNKIYERLWCSSYLKRIVMKLRSVLKKSA